MSHLDATSFTVAVPVYNEEAQIGSLLTALDSDLGITEIICVDDLSNDSSFSIMQQLSAASTKIHIFQNAQRSGQLQAWLRAAAESKAEYLVFLDADCLPADGAVLTLVHALAADEKTVIVSGRVRGDSLSLNWPASRFRQAILHKARSMGFAKEAIIGRFFAVRRTWFVEAARRTDIIANDTYLSCLAVKQNFKALYVASAHCYYAEAFQLKDFAAQRQRANAGYQQLHEMGLLQSEHCPKAIDYLKVLLKCSASDPIGAVAWTANQMRSLFMFAYKPIIGNKGAWETQASTKRKIS